MPSLFLLNTPLLLGAALLFQCALLQGIGICPLHNRIHDPRRVISVAIVLGGTTSAAIFFTALIQQLLLRPAGLDYFDSFAAVICSALCVHIALLLLQRTEPLDFTDRNTTALLLQIGTLGTAVVFNRQSISLAQNAAHALFAGVAFALIYVLFAALRARLELSDVPAPFRGTAIHLISAGLVALALIGFAGLA